MTWTRCVQYWHHPLNTLSGAGTSLIVIKDLLFSIKWDFSDVI